MTIPRPAAADGSPDELLERARDGDVSAFARLVRLRHEALTRTALVVTLDTAMASQAATLAFEEAWRAMRSGSWRRPRDADELDRWLGALAVDEGVRLLGFQAALDPYPGGDALASRAPVEPGSLAGLDADDRALLALAVVVRLPPDELAGTSRRHPADVQAHVDRLTAHVLGEIPAAASGSAQTRLRACLVTWSAAVPVPRVDADRVARGALVSEVHQREHRVSVAIGLVAGLVVATYPYWAPLLSRR